MTPAVPPAQGEPTPAPGETAPEPTGGLAEQAQNVAKRVSENLRGQSITLGGGYSRDKFSIYKLQGIPTEGLGIALVDMTDSGTLTPYVQYDSAERPLASAPLKAGALTLGYNFTATYSTFDVNRELIDNPWGGEDRGTRVHGDFFLAGALVFARLGPLFPGSEVFWHAGFGGGGALMRYTGNVDVRQGQHFGELHDVSGGADNLRLFTTLLWELQFGHWLVSFRTLTIGFGSSDEQAQLTRDSLSLAYNFQF